MYKICIKAGIGALVGIIIFCLMCSPGVSSLSSFALCVLWGIGTIYGIRALMKVLMNILNSSMQLSVISALSLGTGIIGLIILIVGLFGIISIGWLYGIYLLIIDCVKSRKV